VTADIQPLGNVIHYLRGITFKPEEKIDPKAKAAVVCMRTANIQEVLDESDLIAVPSSLVKRNELYLREGDILLSSANSWNLVGKVCRVPKLSYSATAGGFISVVRPRSIVDGRYLYHWLSSPPIQKKIRGCARQTTNISNLSVPQFEQLHILVPFIAEQRRIADILDKADAIRRKRKEAIALTEELLRSAFLEMFGDPVTNPKGWPRSSFGDQVEVLEYGPRFYNESYSEDGVRIVRITDLDTTGQLDFSAMPRLLVDEKDRDRYLLKPGDVIFARSGATVGKTALSMPGDPEAIPGAYFIRLRFTPDVRPLYAREVLASDRVQQIIVARSRQSAQQNFSGPGIRELPLPMPPVSLQIRLEQIAIRRDELLERYQQASVESEALFSSLVHRAFKAAM
jgi:type I restriction enzyme S subunit